jgi:uncharacterized protein (DUF952 family)
MTILHITSRPEWQSAERRGLFAASSLMTEGFIHFSTPDQVIPVANSLYHGQNGLVLLLVDESRLKPELRWEPAAGTPAAGISASELFPHVYGPLNVDAVVSVVDFSPDPAGGFSLPPLN